MNRIVSYLFVCLAFSALSSFAAAFAADRHIAFERNNAVYVANLDGTNEKRIADGSLPAISPDGMRIAFNILETGSETTFVSHIAVADIAIGKLRFLNLCRVIEAITQHGRRTELASFLHCGEMSFGTLASV